MVLRFIANGALLRMWAVQKSLIVDQTHLVLASGKLVIPKKYKYKKLYFKKNRI